MPESQKQNSRGWNILEADTKFVRNIFLTHFCKHSSVLKSEIYKSQNWITLQDS